MREIKFRAWVKEKKVMGKVLTFLHLDWSSPEIVVEAFTGKKHQTFSGYYKDWETIPAKFELMQYTGLKDWNNKEIYEDDVLKLRQGDTDESKGLDPYDIGTLAWVDGRYMFLTDNDALEMNECLIAGKFDGEVIGNIYENPELLKA